MKCVGWLAVLVAVAGLGCQSSTMTAAKLYIKQEQPQEAKKQLVLVLQTEPENSEAHLLMGKLLGKEGRYGEMAEHLAHAERNPKFQSEVEQTRRQFWTREYNAGVVHAQGEAPNYAMARHSFHNATIIDESALDAWRNLAYVYYQIDSTDAAIATYQKIASAAPEDEDAFFSLGSLYLENDNLDEAIRALSQVVKINPENLNGLTNLAIAQAQAEDYEGAEANYRKVIELNPDDFRPHFNLGNLYWQQEKYTAAKRAYEQVLQLEPGDGDALYNLAMVHLATEDMDGALPLLEQLTEQMPDNALVWLHLGTVYAHKELIEKSEAAYARAEELEE
ncbi:MAG: tetratricopeptide repeat protein [Gemmatimonadetes bacterium]|nr:tetratricopeptide repeat protein [Gemmatimonadota bacterium]